MDYVFFLQVLIKDFLIIRFNDSAGFSVPKYLFCVQTTETFKKLAGNLLKFRGLLLLCAKFNLILTLFCMFLVF